MKTRIAFFMLILSFSLHAQSWDNISIKTTQVSDNIYMLEGRGGNIAIQKGDDGLLMIDAQYAPLSEKISAAIAEIAPGNVKYLLNTHWHGDHTGGNEHFGNKGTTIIAHENVRQRVSTEQNRNGEISQPKPESAWPVLTFDKKMHVYFNDEDIHLFHIGKAHTDGDAMVYFEKENVLHMGDIYFAGRYPYIDLSSNGDVSGFFKAVDQAIYLVNDETKIIPGHGKLSNKKELLEYKEVIGIVVNRIKTAVEAGKTLDEVLDADLTADYDEKWGAGFMNPKRFTTIIYTYYSTIDE